MDKSKLLKLYGLCYNDRDFGKIQPMLGMNVTYEAFDCMYSVISADEVIKVLYDSCKDKTSAYEGFYLRKSILLEKLIECILICDDNDLKSIRIIDVKSKRGKIINITGVDPDEHMHTRGKRLMVKKGGV